MKNSITQQFLEKESEKILSQFRDGTLHFEDYVFGMDIPYQMSFEEWISDLEEYLDVSQEELKGEKRLLTAKSYFLTMDDDRLRYLLAEPQSITEDESLEWRRALYKNDDYYTDFLILIPINHPSGEVGSVIIRSYSNIPGGEYEMQGVFLTLEEGQRFLDKYSM